MEIKIIENKKHKLILEVEGVSHGFCNALVKELDASKETKSAGYHIDHPLVGIPKILFETNGEAKKELLKAVKNIRKKTADFQKEFQKSVK